jgi:hypothetical protein
MRGILGTAEFWLSSITFPTESSAVSGNIYCIFSGVIVRTAESIKILQRLLF